ncbi:response regulator [Pseudoroseomonas cervicalis]|uniref:response regulator n=1 Tax=Teichococcus cervicalis TaxID=204525 RepID=UPI0022F163A7|nr:response regulator [Pseudoroseomonas cervicalis]WBV42614.1 response regulator [Pseudoroseomonas cervicalis]
MDEVTHTILVVDDDAGIREVVADSLRGHGYRLFDAPDVRAMQRVLAAEPVDLILLDVMMPGENGLSACQRLAGGPHPPVVMLSALDTPPDRIAGLNAGADYYLGKPSSPGELLAVVRATLRRGAKPAAAFPSHRVRFLGWTADFSAHELRDPQGVLIHLTDGEMIMLKAFVERPRRVLSRDQLLNAARGPDSDAFDRAVDVQVSRLRRKLRSSGDELIRTIRNEGYMFVPATQRL